MPKILMESSDYRWRVPRSLPPCWWLAARFMDRIELRDAFDSKEDAQKELPYFRDEVKQWLDRPTKVEIFAEDPSLRYRRSPRMQKACHVAARWIWIRRNCEVLSEGGTARECSMLVTATGNTSTSDLVRHRLGGPAVLPKDMPWPTFSIPRARLEWERAKGRKVSPRRKTWGTFVGVYVLRGLVSFKRFPEAIALFVSCYGSDADSEREYSDWADPYQPVGRVVPLFAGDDLHEVEAPCQELQQPLRELRAWLMPDFPPLSRDMDEALADVARRNPARQLAAERLQRAYDEIAHREPGTEGWIHLQGNKIAGHESYIQGNLTRRLPHRTSIQWQWIATCDGGRVILGDSGILSIFAGWDRQAKSWKWHCEWQCH